MVRWILKEVVAEPLESVRIGNRKYQFPSPSHEFNRRSDEACRVGSVFHDLEGTNRVKFSFEFVVGLSDWLSRNVQSGLARLGRSQWIQFNTCNFVTIRNERVQEISLSAS
jgi:hypothetical protein